MSLARRAAAAVLLSATAAPALAAPPEPPLAVSLRLLAADGARGRYRVEVRLRSAVALEEAALTVRVAPRAGGGPAGAAAAPRRESRQALSLTPGRELRRELDVLTGPAEPVTLLVGLGGRFAGARLHRTRGLELGPQPPGPAARVRTDQLGRTYYEVPLREDPR